MSTSLTGDDQQDIDIAVQSLTSGRCSDRWMLCFSSALAWCENTRDFDCNKYRKCGLMVFPSQQSW
jgi:hypothetical protein